MSISLQKGTLRTGLICIKGKLFFLFFAGCFPSPFRNCNLLGQSFRQERWQKRCINNFAAKTAEMKYSKQFPQCTARGTELM